MDIVLFRTEMFKIIRTLHLPEAKKMAEAIQNSAKGLSN